MDGNHQKLRENSGKMMLKILYEPCGNEWKMVKMTLLIRFCKVCSIKLPNRSLSSFKISEFEPVGS